MTERQRFERWVRRAKCRAQNPWMNELLLSDESFEMSRPGSPDEGMYRVACLEFAWAAWKAGRR